MMAVNAEGQLQERVRELEAELAERRREAAENERQLERYAADLRETFKEERARAQELRRSYMLTVRALASAVEARDAYTGRHAERVAAYGLRLAAACGMELGDHPEIEFGFLLHDAGKVAVPDAILFKPGPLTSAERLIMQQHPVTGWEIVRDIEFLGTARDVIRHHHERWDGTGYPDGLARRGDPALGADLRRRRHARRADDEPPLPAGVDDRAGARDHHAGRRDALRPGRHRGLRGAARRRRSSASGWRSDDRAARRADRRRRPVHPQAHPDDARGRVGVRPARGRRRRGGGAGRAPRGPAARVPRHRHAADGRHRGVPADARRAGDGGARRS